MKTEEEPQGHPPAIALPSNQGTTVDQSSNVPDSKPSMKISLTSVTVTTRETLSLPWSPEICRVTVNSPVLGNRWLGLNSVLGSLPSPKSVKRFISFIFS